MKLAVLLIAGFLAATTIASPSPVIVSGDDFSGDVINSVKDVAGALRGALAEALSASGTGKMAGSKDPGNSKCDSVYTMCNNIMKLDWTKYEQDMQTLLSNENVIKLTNKLSEQILDLITGGFDNYLIQ